MTKSMFAILRSHVWTTSDENKNFADFIANNYQKNKKRKEDLSLKKYLRIKIKKEWKKKNI